MPGNETAPVDETVPHVVAESVANVTGPMLPDVCNWSLKGVPCDADPVSGAIWMVQLSPSPGGRRRRLFRQRRYHLRWAGQHALWRARHCSLECCERFGQQLEKGIFGSHVGRYGFSGLRHKNSDSAPDWPDAGRAWRYPACISLHGDGHRSGTDRVLQVFSKSLILEG